MATPTREAIETFMRITGSTESVALRKLEEYGGNLDGAINAHFMEDDRQFPTVSSQYDAASPRYDFAGTSIHRQARPRGIFPLLSAARSFRPSLLLDRNYRRNLFNQIGASVTGSHNPLHTQPGEFNYGYAQPYLGPRLVADAERNSSSYHYQNDGDISRTHEDHHDIEEQIMQHAIEASKQEHILAQDLNNFPQSHLSLEDDELVHALSLSLKTAEQENAIRAQLALEEQKDLINNETAETSEKMKDSRSQRGSSSSQRCADDLQEQSLWGGISSKELDEAILLETALFGQNPAGTSFQHSLHPKRSSDKGLHQQRLLREQQDNEYLVSLLADTEKEKSDSKKPESSDCNEVEAQNKMPDEEELERLLASKEASLPLEPAIVDENAVTILVRLPDGTRCSRRFLKSDKLQYLYDFIDTARVVKPRTYNLVKPYPRCIFSTSDSLLSLNEVGLTNKQEALFLEMI